MNLLRDKGILKPTKSIFVFVILSNVYLINVCQTIVLYNLVYIKPFFDNILIIDIKFFYIVNNTELLNATIGITQYRITSYAFNHIVY